MSIFKTFPGEHAPGPPKTFFVFQSASTLFGRKINTLAKSVEIIAPLPFEISRYATVD